MTSCMLFGALLISELLELFWHRVSTLSDTLRHGGLVIGDGSCVQHWMGSTKPNLQPAHPVPQLKRF